MSRRLHPQIIHEVVIVEDELELQGGRVDRNYRRRQRKGNEPIDNLRTPRSQRQFKGSFSQRRKGRILTSNWFAGRHSLTKLFEFALQSFLCLGPFLIQNAEVNGVPQPAGMSDEVLAQRAFFSGANAQNRIS